MFSSKDESFLQGLGFLAFVVIVFFVFAFIYQDSEKEKNASVVETEVDSVIYPLADMGNSFYLKSSDLPIYKFVIMDGVELKSMSASFSDSVVIDSDKDPYVEIKTINWGKGRKKDVLKKYFFYIPKDSIDF